MERITIVKDRRNQSGWVTIEVDGFFRAIAKVCDEGDGEKNPNDYQGYGVEIGSRVSKLSIYEGPTGSEIYSWDRGLDFDNAPEGLVAEIVAFCDELPRT